LLSILLGFESFYIISQISFKISRILGQVWKNSKVFIFQPEHLMEEGSECLLSRYQALTVMIINKIQRRIFISMRGNDFIGGETIERSLVLKPPDLNPISFDRPFRTAFRFFATISPPR